MFYDSKNLEEKVDRQEQYSLWNCPLIHCVKEDVNEDTGKLPIQLIEDDFEVDFTIYDLVIIIESVIIYKVQWKKKKKPEKQKFQHHWKFNYILNGKAAKGKRNSW